MTEKETGMTEKERGMTEKERGMTENYFSTNCGKVSGIHCGLKVEFCVKKIKIE